MRLQALPSHIQYQQKNGTQKEMFVPTGLEVNGKHSSSQLQIRTVFTRSLYGNTEQVNKAHMEETMKLKHDNDAFSFPIFLDLKIPLPLKVLHFVVISKQALDSVCTTSKHSRWRLFFWRYVRLQLRLRSVAANHKRRLVDCNKHRRNISSASNLSHCQPYEICPENCIQFVTSQVNPVYKR